MTSRLVLWTLGFILCLPHLSSAKALSVEQRLQDFRQLAAMMSAQYGPLQFKKDQKIADLEALVPVYESRISQTKSNQEFYNEMFRFVATFRDGHFSIRLPTTYAANLPFQFDLIQGKVLLSGIDRTLISEAQFPFAIGDELIEFGGLSARELLDQLQVYVASGSLQSIRSFTAWMITTRRGNRMPVPTEKTVTMKLRRGTSEIVETTTQAWIFSGTQSDENDTLSNSLFFGDLRGSLARPSMAMALSPLAEVTQQPMADRKYMCNPISRIQIPADAKIITKTPFTSYVYPTAKGLVGYVRIPDYYPVDAKGEFTEAAAAKYFERYRFVIAKMEKETVGLIIDQDHNCGGSVALVEDMASLFMNRPFSPQLFKLRASKWTLQEAKTWFDQSEPNTFENTFSMNLIEMIEKAMKAGESLTDFSPITGRNMIYPDRLANYTKPVLMLIDQMAGSGGDAFPSLLKGEGRVRLFGQQTSGLGGSVDRVPSLFHSQMTVRMTQTQFYKPDRSPVENNGAVPDVEYEITRDDMLYGFKPYQKAFTEELLKMVP